MIIYDSFTKMSHDQGALVGILWNMSCYGVSENFLRILIFLLAECYYEQDCRRWQKLTWPAHTCGWSGSDTLTNCNGQKGGDFLKSSLIWVGNWQKKNFSPRALRDIAILKLPYSDTMVIGHSVPFFDNQLNILWPF